MRPVRAWAAILLCLAVLAGIASVRVDGASPQAITVREYAVPAGSQPHDVAPARDGGVWYTAQGSGELGWRDPKTGDTRHVPLGDGSAPTA